VNTRQPSAINISQVNSHRPRGYFFAIIRHGQSPLMGSRPVFYWSHFIMDSAEIGLLMSSDKSNRFAVPLIQPHWSMRRPVQQHLAVAEPQILLFWPPFANHPLERHHIMQRPCLICLIAAYWQPLRGFPQRLWTIISDSL
jgi:hypothetical protein